MTTKSNKNLKGFYRVANQGSYVVQIQTRFASVKRLQMSSSVYPETPNAEDTLRKMKLMLKEMNRNGDVETLMKLKERKIRLRDLFNAYLSGREKTLHGNEHTTIYSALIGLSKIQKSVYSAKNFANAAATLLSKQFITKSTTVGEMPTVLSKLSDYYQNERKPTAFNRIREAFLLSLTKFLKHTKNSPIFSLCHEVPSHRVLRRKQHSPLRSPRHLYELYQYILTDARIRNLETRNIYAESVLIMTLHGFRPTEYFNRLFARDKISGHLRINGSKNQFSDRVVPMLTFPSELSKNRTAIVSSSTLNSYLKQYDPLLTTRDFRRTYSIFCEAAGIVRSHIQYYFGHANREMLDLYQRKHTFTRELLNEDRAKLQKFLESDLNTAQSQQTPSPFAPSSQQFFGTLAKP